MRQIFIGDIQGCFDEFQDLLAKVQFDVSSDELYLVGDVINRGPKSREMLDYLIEHPKSQTVIGNHELHFLEALDQGVVKKKFSRLHGQLKDRLNIYKKFINSWPSTIESEQWILVHAGLLPDTPIDKTDRKILCTIRTLPDPEQTPWFDAYPAKKMVIFGHWAKRGLIKKGFFRGLDTGCVYGKELTALVLPDDRFVSVKARQMYYDPLKKKALW